jgi:hypothetical protein
MPVNGSRPYRLRPHRAPILDAGWGHDNLWEWRVVERIRQGYPAPQAHALYETSANGGWPAGADDSGWEYAEEHSKNAIRTNAVYLNDTAIARRKAERQRAALEEAEWAERNAKIEAAEAEKRERDRQIRARERAEKEAERAQTLAAWRQRLAEQERRDAEQIAEWERMQAERAAETKEHGEAWAQKMRERDSILANTWQCSICKALANIMVEGDGYRITCPGCGKTAWGSHQTLLGMRR